MPEPRICIAGSPRTGKTFLATRMGELLRLKPLHTDDLIGHLEWSDASLEVSRWMGLPAPWVIEGVAVPRALRKRLAASPDRPCDVLVLLSNPWEQLTSGQIAMGKGIRTVLEQIRPELRARGVEIVDGEAALEAIRRTSEAAQ